MQTQQQTKSEQMYAMMQLPSQDEIPTPKGDYTQESDTKSTPFTSLRKQSELNAPLRYAPLNIQQLFRQWLAMRWQLKVNVLDRPIPYLTSTLNIRLGTILLTIPLAMGSITANTVLFFYNDLEGSGTIPSIGLAIVYVLAMRHNFLMTWLTGISFEHAIFYHKFAAIVTIILSGLHGAVYYRTEIDNFFAGKGLNFSSWLSLSKGRGEEDKALTGLILFGCMIAITLLSLYPIRRYFFQGFLYIHWILLLGILVMSVIHGANLSLVGFIPFALDMIFRLAYRVPLHANGVASEKHVQAFALPGNIVRIQFPREHIVTKTTFNYIAGQFAFLCIPGVSRFEWHPFSISSAPHEKMVTFHIKALGDWTRGLYNYVEKLSQDKTDAPNSEYQGVNLPILLDGPYGDDTIHVNGPEFYSHFAMFSGGIGITPIKSIVNNLYHQQADHNDINYVHLVSCFRKYDELDAMFHGANTNIESEQLAYIPDMIHNQKTSNMRDSFTTDIYLTMESYDEDRELDQKLLGYVRYNTRPDIPSVLLDVGKKAAADGRKRVGVLVCGPEKLTKKVVQSSSRLSRKMNINFDVYTNPFKF